MNKTEDQNKEFDTSEKKKWEAILLPTIIISGFFMLLTGLVLLFNYLQLSSTDPIESQTITALLERLSDDPNNETLRNEIRVFDLMSRKAYFTGKWQIETGGLLLLISAIFFIISFRSYQKTIKTIKPPHQNPIKQQSIRLLSSRWLIILGGIFIVLSLTASFFSINYLNKYEPAIEYSEQQQNDVEVVELITDAAESLYQTLPQPLPQPQNQHQNQHQTQPQAIKKYPSLAEIQKQYNTFRGPLAHGIYEDKNTPLKWDVETGENIVWKKNIPLKGYSSPVIWNDKLFVTGANNDQRWVYCYNKQNGEMLWQQQANNINGSPATTPKTTDDTGLAAPSVVTNGQQVVAIFGTGDIIAFDMNGKRLWAKNLGVPDNHYGHSSSLLNWNEKVFVQYDTNKGGRLLALNIETGESIWDVTRTNKISWSSPILAEVDGKMQVITTSTPSVAGHDAENGKELWKIDCLSGEVGPSAGFGNGLVFAANEYATLAAINPSKGEIVWQDNYYLPEVASPVVAQGIVFIATTYGVLAAFDAHTGNMYWEAEFNEGFYSSPIVAGDKIYAADMNGEIHIIKVDREYELIGSNAMSEKMTTTPAFNDGRIYVRGSETLFCIGQP